MTRSTLFFVYIFFFFMYFIGFELMGYLNMGIPYPWEKIVRPTKLSYYVYTLITVLLAHFVVFKKYYYAKPRRKLLVAVIALLCFFTLLRYLIEEIIYPLVLGYGNYTPATTFRFYIVDNIYFGAITIFIGFVLFLFDEMFHNQKKQRALHAEKRKAELSFLQAQMNPHFLFNSLNNIYSLVREQHPKAPDSILRLSDMMRYVTYQKEQLVPLEKEWNYIHNMIEIYQLRYDYKINIRLDIAEEILQHKIMPLLLIPLVENALKHGDLSDPSSGLLIIIKRTDSQLLFEIKNKIADQASDSTGGIGIQNLHRRLELLYQPNEYFFETKKKDTTFLVTISIPFQL